MTTVFLAVLPVFFVIAVGWAARASNIVPRPQWEGINRLAYWVFFPAFLFIVLARADFSAVNAGPFLIAGTAGFLTMAVLVFALRPLLRATPGPSYTSVVQGGVRWNGTVGIASAAPLFGPEGAALIALLTAPIVPLVNTVGVAALSRWGEGSTPTARAFLARLATNPLILACIGGVLANCAGFPTQGPVAAALQLFADAAIAVSLLGVGAGIDLKSLHGHRFELAVAIGLKLLVMPAVLWGWAVAFDLDAVAVGVLVMVGATPGAAASYVLARELGGDAPLTAAHVSATTILSAIAMPVWITLAARAAG